jgi:hypothetical protein
LQSVRTYRPSSHVAAADFDGEMVLLNVTSGIYFGLNPIAARIWQLLDAGLGEHEIVQAMLAEYDVEEARLRADVASTLDQLRTDGLICDAEA